MQPVEDLVAVVIDGYGRAYWLIMTIIIIIITIIIIIIIIIIIVIVIVIIIIIIIIVVVVIISLFSEAGYNLLQPMRLMWTYYGIKCETK